MKGPCDHRGGPTTCRPSPLTFGKTARDVRGDLLLRGRELDLIIDNYTGSGLKGPVGTQMDLLTLRGAGRRWRRARRAHPHHLRVGRGRSTTVGQVYTAGLDFEVGFGSRPSFRAFELRQDAAPSWRAQELASEGFAKGQVGSSAMPHKMNSRSCERLNGSFRDISRATLNDGGPSSPFRPVERRGSCLSVVRRVFLARPAFTRSNGPLFTFNHHHSTDGGLSGHDRSRRTRRYGP